MAATSQCPADTGRRRAGAPPERGPARCARLKLRRVDLADGAYAQVRCAVVPLLRRCGGSPTWKLVEALAYGLPVVATPRAVAGLDVQDGLDLA